MHCDVAVVGGGPAGLVAARGLAMRGLAVTLIDEHRHLGGQYYKRREGAVLSSAGEFRPRGTELIEAVKGAGVVVLNETVAWGVADDRRTLLLDNRGRVLRVTAEKFLIATGAHERSLPFRGWQLPGVVTPGAALHLATIDRVSVGQRVLVGGAGPFLWPVACALLDVGANVLAVVEANQPYRLTRRGLAAARFPRQLAELLSYALRLRRARVPILQGWLVAEASGRAKVQRVTLQERATGRTRELPIDAVAVGYGFRPNHELAALMGVAAATDKSTHDPILTRTIDGRTNVPDVYLAGEVAGIAGVRAAELRGALVASAIASDLGLGVRGREVTALRRRLTAVDRFAALAEDLFAPPVDEVADGLDDDVQVCRCEGVTAGRIRLEARLGWNDASATKGACRAGMGSCQGRQCGATIARLVAVSGGPASGFSTRMPVKPVRIGSLIEGDTVE